jgi:phosphoglycolate phosphatase
MNLIFDLDGTLIDSRPRLYSLYRQLVPDTKLDFERYWNFKRSKTPHSQLLRDHEGFGDTQISQFEVEWMALIETPKLLALDINFPGMPQALERLARQATLHVCTARQLHEPVLEQMERLGLAKYFRNILVTLQHYPKESLIAANVADLSPMDWMIGDTGKDIEVGRTLGIRTCAVLSGFLSRESLKDYKPDMILSCATEFHLS